MSERTKILESIFHRAFEMDSPEERESYLKEACAGDPDLRQDVEALLNAAAIGDKLFESCDQKDLSRAESPSGLPAPEDGSVIGRYKLLEKIGEGGMGVVYMAEQEHPVRRKVALKIIKLGMDTRQVVARFEAERQALAMMDHPHIAQVLDAGATETGRPYFVMELVQGVPITEFCEANKLSVLERLQLFFPVCQAIQSAHQKGIIHRDIKPSNVLVTIHDGSPHPMVIDFGVAKAIDQKLTEKTLFTNFATMIGTPAYMSPEQAEMSKLDVDTRSDIYSLGVLLYELLTGTTPFSEERLRSVAYGEMQRIILEEEPERPSTRLKRKSATVSPNQSQIVDRKSQIDSDLDWIVMKCLEKDRNRRYDTANGLAADIQRHLDNEPVVARPPSRFYEFQKTVRRHKVGFAATAVVLMVLVAGGAVSAWQAVRASRAEAVAREQAVNAALAEQTARQQAKIASEQTAIAKTEFEHAKAARDFLIENLLGVDCCEGEDSDAMTFEATQALVQKVARRIDGKFPNQPRTEAEIRMALAKGFQSSRDFAQTAFQAEKALEIFRPTLGAGHSNTLEAVKMLAYGKYHAGQRQEAFDLLSEAMVIARQDTNGISPEGSAVIGSYGTLLASDGRPAEALPYLNETLTYCERNNARPLVVNAWKSKIAEATEWSGDLEKAEGLWREVYQNSVRDHGAKSPFTLQQHKAYARLLARRGRWSEARPLLEQAAVLIQAHFGRTNYSTLDVQIWLAKAYEQNKEIERAKALYSELYPQFARHFPYGSATSYAMDIADFFVRQRDYKMAAAVFDSLRISYEKSPLRAPADFERWIAATAASKGWPAAAALCQQQFDSFPDSVSLWLNKAWIFRYVGDAESYQKIVEKVLSLPATVVSSNELPLAIEIAALGSVAYSPEQMRQLDSMMAALEGALPGRATNQQVSGYRAIAHLQLQLGRLDKCLAAIGKIESLEAEPHPYNLFIKAICLHRLNQAEEARALFEQAEAITKPQLDQKSRPGEGFLPARHIYHRIVMPREVKALLGVK